MQRMMPRLASDPHRIHDLSGAFDDMTDTVYVDTCHLLPAGNERIAEILLKDTADRP
jgi:hypothetical protein